MPATPPAKTVAIRNKDKIEIEEEVAKLFDVKEILGSGAYGTVFAAIDKSNGKHVAIKIVSRQRLGPEGQIKMEKEVSIMSALSHPRILRMLCYIPTAHFYNIVMERIEGGELFTHLIKIQRYTERKACRVVMNILKGLHHMHERGFMHSDLKPENLLLVRQPVKEEQVTNVKLADFGLAQVVQPPHNAPNKCCGSPLYIAPEVIEVGFQKTRPYYDTQADMWSLGVVTYLLLSGLIPFFGTTPNEIFKATLKTVHNFKNALWQQVSDTAKDFINKLFVKDPAQRLTAKQALAHEWMQMAAEPDSDDDIELAETQESILRFNAQQKLKGAMYGVEATFRLAYLSGCEAKKFRANSRLVELLTSTTDQITKIDLSNNYLGKNGLKVLVSALSVRSRVAVLNLTNVLLDDEQFNVLFDDFSSPKTALHTLVLAKNELTHHSGRQLVALARSKPQYVLISAEGNHIKDCILQRLTASCAENAERLEKKGILKAENLRAETVMGYSSQHPVTSAAIPRRPCSNPGSTTSDRENGTSANKSIKAASFRRQAQAHAALATNSTGDSSF